MSIPVITPVKLYPIKGQSFGYQLVLSAGTANSYALVSGSVTGLSFTAGSGYFHGTPTANGTFDCVVTATNADGTSAPAHIVFVVGLGSPIIPNQTFTCLATQTVDFPVQTVGGFPVQGWNGGQVLTTGLPPNLAMGVGNGHIQGTITAAGTTAFTVSAFNQYGTGTGTITITATNESSNPVPGTPPTVGNAAFEGVVGQPAYFTFELANAVQTTAPGLPEGLSLQDDGTDPTGTIFGTPLHAGYYSVLVTATNLYGSVTGTITIVISPGQVVINPPPDPQTTSAANLSVEINVVTGAVDVTNGSLTAFYGDQIIIQTTFVPADLAGGNVSNVSFRLKEKAEVQQYQSILANTGTVLDSTTFLFPVTTFAGDLLRHSLLLLDPVAPDVAVTYSLEFFYTWSGRARKSVIVDFVVSRPEDMDAADFGVGTAVPAVSAPNRYYTEGEVDSIFEEVVNDPRMVNAPRQAGNVTILRSLAAPVEGKDSGVLQTTGYATPGDGGGATFTWDADSTEPDNGGTIIALAGVTTGRYKIALDKGTSGGWKVNVKWFGATGVYGTDDTDAIYRAIAAMQASDVPAEGYSVPDASGVRYAGTWQGTLYFPAGSYCLRKSGLPIFARCTVQGESAGLTRLYFQPGTLTNADPETYLASVRPTLVDFGGGPTPAPNFTHDVHVRDIAILAKDGMPADSLASGLLFCGAEISSLENLFIDGCEHALVMTGCGTTEVRNVTATGSRKEAFTVTNQCNHITVTVASSEHMTTLVGDTDAEGDQRSHFLIDGSTNVHFVTAFVESLAGSHLGGLKVRNSQNITVGGIATNLCGDAVKITGASDLVSVLAIKALNPVGPTQRLLQDDSSAYGFHRAYVCADATLGTAYIQRLVVGGISINNGPGLDGTLLVDQTSQTPTRMRLSVTGATALTGTFGTYLLTMHGRNNVAYSSNLCAQWTAILTVGKQENSVFVVGVSKLAGTGFWYQVSTNTADALTIDFSIIEQYSSLRTFSVRKLDGTARYGNPTVPTWTFPAETDSTILDGTAAETVPPSPNNYHPDISELSGISNPTDLQIVEYTDGDGVLRRYQFHTGDATPPSGTAIVQSHTGAGNWYALSSFDWEGAAYSPLGTAFSGEVFANDGAAKLAHAGNNNDIGNLGALASISSPDGFATAGPITFPSTGVVLRYADYWIETDSYHLSHRDPHRNTSGFALCSDGLKLNNSGLVSWSSGGYAAGLQIAGLSCVAPGTLAVGNGASGDASGCVKSSQFLASDGFYANSSRAYLTGDGLFVTDGSYQFVRLHATDSNTVHLRGGSVNDANLSLGNLTASGYLTPGPRTTDTLPDPTDVPAGSAYYVSDAPSPASSSTTSSGGGLTTPTDSPAPRWFYSDGQSWRDFAYNALV